MWTQPSGVDHPAVASGRQVARHRRRAAQQQLAALGDPQLGVGHQPAGRARHGAELAVGHRAAAPSSRSGPSPGRPRRAGSARPRPRWSSAPSGAPPLTISWTSGRSTRQRARSGMTGGGTMTTDTRWRPSIARKPSGSKRGTVTSARAGRERRAERDHEAHHVRERREGEHDVIGRQPDAAQDLPHGGDEVRVGDHDALGQAARAAGVREQRHASGRHGRPRRVAGRATEPGPMSRGVSSAAPESVDLALDLRRRRGHRDAGHGAAEAHGAERDPGPRRQVRRLQREHVAGSEAAGGERRRHAVGPLGERRVGQLAAAAVDERHAVPSRRATSSWNVVPPTSTGAYRLSRWSFDTCQTVRFVLHVSKEDPDPHPRRRVAHSRPSAGWPA